ncbi:Predicted DNA-binding protein, MmcQ/YjbR family [Marivirga sericea]|uniref:Predicted DNA-binding protein, MmcQ/YjbR family n=1 Tax=Marivirga sericea TaxID=1028 RepID=A0A1X7KDE9_9BACT|nr:MmcQ/YjbR family DNA-binding protein [Marivirga sericea]SMG39246.1 Predicted DNA-binding protein, MmcQ/YjbR family [Marivirga sericea]
MNIEDFRNFCIQKYGVTEELPFDENTLAFKVMGKIFALIDVELFQSVNLKCDPNEAVKLRERFEAVKPGYHMNKKHWNTINFDGSLADREIFHWVNHSYDLVVSKLPKRLREEVNQNK